LTIAHAIAAAASILTAAGVDTPRLDAQLLLAWVLDCRREDLAREPERVLDEDSSRRFDAVVARRAAREPLPYITGRQQFYGRAFRVNGAVLIPRPETELLVSLALKFLTGKERPRIVDVGTGSGCIAVSIACERPGAVVWATDLSEAALAVAQSNAEALGVLDQVTLQAGSLLSPVLDAVRTGKEKAFDLVVSNPPYVSTDDLDSLQPEVRDYEPGLALVGAGGSTGVDGTSLYPSLFEQAFGVLFARGSIIVEIGLGQAAAVSSAAKAAGYVNVEVHRDMAGIPRVVTAEKW
jgi:release factor glutamine methyltransferase